MDKLDIVTDESGNEVVLLPEIIFSNKQNINWNDVEDYLGKYVGELIEIAETPRHRRHRWQDRLRCRSGQQGRCG